MRYKHRGDEEKDLARRAQEKNEAMAYRRRLVPDPHIGHCFLCQKDDVQLTRYYNGFEICENCFTLRVEPRIGWDTYVPNIDVTLPPEGHAASCGMCYDLDLIPRGPGNSILWEELMSHH